MSSIDLKKFDSKFGTLNLREDKERTQKSGFKFADVKLDLSIGDIITNFPIDQRKVTNDAQMLVDEEAIKQSVSNIFNTIPGQKLLNPYIGLDLKRFLFSPITESTGHDIALAILEGLVEQEPRISVKDISIEGVIAQSTYYISFSILFPMLKNTEIKTSGKLNSTGFILTSSNKAWENKGRQVRDRYWDFN